VSFEVTASLPAWRIHERQGSGLLIDGRDYYRAFYAAALKAQRSILLLGWQFDSDVELLRGEDLPPGAERRDVELVALLDRLCRERPGLRVCVLAWDFSVFFALEREVLQKLYFDAITCAGFRFRWDDTVPLGGSHHQKVAIIDGQIAFTGSQDICQARWDDSSHHPTNPLRFSRLTFHQPYHEVQVALSGEAARSMVDLFVERWQGATGERLDPNELVAATRFDDLAVTLPMPPARIGIARTVPAYESRPAVREVASLFVGAVSRAERLIYIESQYLTSSAFRDALVERMRDRKRPRLDIVCILPFKPEKLKEEMTVAVPQRVLLRTIEEEARRSGHDFRAFNVLAGVDDDGEPLHVYIHSKVMIVDDRWFIVGSANLTNRSMTIDSEICVVYDGDADPAVAHGIRRARVRLLSEHVGREVARRYLEEPEGLAVRLDALARRKKGRLRPHLIGEVEPGLLARTFHELTYELLDPRERGVPARQRSHRIGT
jgi:phospholipase D1/2